MKNKYKQFYKQIFIKNKKIKLKYKQTKCNAK
jgi:hypothetical protein